MARHVAQVGKQLLLDRFPAHGQPSYANAVGRRCVLIVDEAHNFKNLKLITKMTRVAGVPSSGSDRAFDLFIESREA